MEAYPRTEPQSNAPGNPGAFVVALSHHLTPDDGGTHESLERVSGAELREFHAPTVPLPLPRNTARRRARSDRSTARSVRAAAAGGSAPSARAPRADRRKWTADVYTARNRRPFRAAPVAAPSTAVAGELAGTTANSRSLARAAAAGWKELLARYEWKFFITLTFRDNARGHEPAPEAAEKAVRAWVSEIHEQLYASATPAVADFTDLVGIRYAVAIERGQDLRINCHLLLAGGDRVGQARWEPWSRRWFAMRGCCRIARPRNQGDVAGYCAKYTVKGGDVELRSTWEDKRERLREVEAPLFDGPRPPGLEIVQSSELLRASNAASWRWAAQYATGYEIAPGSTGPERDAGESTPAAHLAIASQRDAAGVLLFPELSVACSAERIPTANKTGARSVTRRAARQFARYHSYMSRNSKHIAVVCSLTAIAS